MSRDYDVIVVGSGAAGLSAAVSAAEAGASVLIVEADTQVGGSSRLSGGHFYAAGTSIQREAGIEDDTAEAMFEHYMTLNQWMVEPSVVRRYCELSAPTFEWLREHGVEFSSKTLYESGVGPVPRGHPPEGGGEAVVQALDAQCSDKGVDIVMDSRVDELLRDDAGGVIGIRIGDDEASCGAVVMAAGGFGANPGMYAEHYPDAATAGNWSWYIGSPMARGDGLKLGQAAGAALDGHNRGLLLVTPGFSRDLEVLLPGWLILVNQQGRRFTDETAPYTVLGGLIQRQGGRAFAVFDEAAREGARRSPVSQAYWVDEILEQKSEDGTIVRADTLEDLAGRAEIHPAGLIGTVERYNADCERGEDSAFFKNPATGMCVIEKPPFYAVEVRPAIVCWTGTGLRINADACVVGTDERAISGLYAAGETVGSLHGDRYIGGGGSFGPCVVFGKLAGERAARYAAELG
ncbi:MAG: FAD-dependent oxidoreductase [Gammaproteobacteria bacterium]|nr:FAD-dependent oxidoreductase [Gammaproteobacteria bacterium]